MMSTSSFETRLAEADSYLKLLIDQAKVCMNDSVDCELVVNLFQLRFTDFRSSCVMEVLLYVKIYFTRRLHRR